MNFSIQSVYNWYRNLLRNPKYRWWVIIGTIVYFISPIDIAPDFIPIVGELDDIFLMTLLVSEVSQLVLDSFKAKQANQGDKAPSADSSPAQSGETVDVDAVSVK